MTTSLSAPSAVAREEARRHDGRFGPLPLAEADVVLLPIDDDDDDGTEPAPVEWRTRFAADSARVTSAFGSTETHRTHATELARDWLEGPGADWLDDISDPETASGLCQDASESFAEWAASRGHTVECVDLTDGGAHTVALLDGVTVVDLTLRQFDAAADVPTVVTLDSFLGNAWDVTYRWSPARSAP